MVAWTHCVVPASGIDIQVMRGGTGTPLVILHRDIGSPERLPFYDALARHHDVIIPCHPGYGATLRQDWVRSVRDIAVIHRSMLGTLGVAGATLVGLGFGGWIAAEMATFAPSDTPRLVLVGAMGVKPPEGEILDQALLSYIEYVQAGFHDPAAFTRNFGEQQTTEQLVLWDLCREMSFRVAWKPYMYSPSLPYLLRGVTAKSLVVNCGSDRIVPASAGRLYAERLRSSRLATIADVGHLAEMEQPDTLATMILSFIAAT